MNIFLFGGTVAHREAIGTMWVDRTIHLEVWRKYLASLQIQWRDFTIAVSRCSNINAEIMSLRVVQATVLLNADLAFLSIQSVDNDGLAVADRSPTQILIYVSTVTSLSSMLLSLFMLKQSENQRQEPADKVVRLLVVSFESEVWVLMINLERIHRQQWGGKPVNHACTPICITDVVVRLIGIFSPASY